MLLMASASIAPAQPTRSNCEIANGDAAGNSCAYVYKVPARRIQKILSSASYCSRYSETQVNCSRPLEGNFGQMLLGAPIGRPPVTAPGLSVTITSPANNGVVANIATIQGTATGTVSSVTTSIDGGPAVPCVGTTAWGNFGFYAKNLPEGRHTVTAKATDPTGRTASSTITVEVVHTKPICAHTLIGQGIFCEQAATSSDAKSVTFPKGYAAGNLILVGAVANDRHVPWQSSDLSNTAGFQWTFWGNVTSGDLDDDLVQTGIFYTVVPATTPAADTITVTKPTSTFTIVDAVVYSGIGAIDGPGASARGWGGPGVGDAKTGDYPVSPGDLNVAFVVAAPTIPGEGWAERVEDISRPFTMFCDQIAASTTASATWMMNPEGYVGIGLAFKPAQP